MGAHEAHDMVEDLREVCADMLHGKAEMQTLSPTRHLLSWDTRESSGFIHACLLASGVSMHVARVKSDQPFDWEMACSPSPVEFSLMRGPEAQTITHSGETTEQSGSLAMVSQTHERGRLQCKWSEAGVGEFVCLSVSPERLTELLGASELPPSLQDIVEVQAGRPQITSALTQNLQSILDELIELDPARSATPLFLEAKGMETLGIMLDRLEEPPQSAASRLHETEVVRLQDARRLLHEQMQTPPSLRQLARYAGLSETRFKTGFRELFGRPVFTDLREHRLNEAHRLLRRGRQSVTEVAAAVGYENPSKFAAAFKKTHGISPSSVGRQFDLTAWS